MPHERSRVAVKRSGVTAMRVAVDAQLALQRADAGEARRVEQDAVALAPDVLRLADRAVLGAVDEVEADALLVGVADEAQLVERLDHLDAVRADLLASSCRRGASPTVADRPLLVAAAHGRVRVDDAEVRVHAHAGDEVRVGLVVDALVDAAVVHVAVARPDVAHRERHLMDRVFVEGIELEHRAPLRSKGQVEPDGIGPDAAGRRGQRAACCSDRSRMASQPATVTRSGLPAVEEAGEGVEMEVSAGEHLRPDRRGQRDDPATVRLDGAWSSSVEPDLRYEASYRVAMIAVPILLSSL